MNRVNQYQNECLTTSNVHYYHNCQIADDHLNVEL